MTNRSHPRKGKISLSLALAVLMLGGISQASAAIDTWNGTTDFDWNTPSNWSSGLLPATTDTALFDGAGSGSPVTFTSVTLGTAGSIQFGQASETTGASIPGYTLGTGSASSTINVGTAAAGTAGFLNYYGTANTATQTINANIAFGGNATYYINNDSGGSLVIAGNITTAGTPDLTNLHIGDATIGNSGNVVLQGNTYTLGNTATRLGMRLFVNGTTGALVFNNATGIRLYGGGADNTNYPIWLNKSRTSESQPHLVFASGNNIIEGAGPTSNRGGINLNDGAGSGEKSYYVRVDEGATVAVSEFYYGINNTAINSTVYLYGEGDGVVYSHIVARYGGQMKFVKDGGGSWAFNAATSTFASLYTGGVTVRNGTFLAIGSNSTGTGTVLVDPTGSFEGGAAAPVFGGTGTVTGPVIVKNGGKIAAGGAATGGDDAYATVTSPLNNIGTLTINNTLTAESGAIFAFDLNSSVAPTLSLGVSDQLIVSGALTLGGATLSLNDLGSMTLSSGDYFSLISYTGGLSGTFANLAQGDLLTLGANIYSIDYGVSHANAVTLNWVSAAVPEPSTWAMCVGGLGLLVVLRNLRGQCKAEEA